MKNKKQYDLYITDLEEKIEFYKEENSKLEKQLKQFQMIEYINQN